VLSPYRRIFAVPGAKLFCAYGLVGRLPISMVTLGIVLGVTLRHGSYTLAGSVSAAFVVAEAVGAVVHGRLVDRLGQARWLPVSGLAFAAAMAALMAAIESGWPAPLPHLLAALAGLALPPVGACIRARWAHVLSEPAQRRTAYSLESAIDECVFMLGPTAVTVLATLWFPMAGLLVGVSASVVGILALASQRSTQPPPLRGHSRRRTSSGRLPLGVFGPLTVGCVAVGALFAGVEVTTLAFSQIRHQGGYAGPLLAVWALGSFIAGLVSGAISWRAGATRRVRLGLLALAALTAPFAAARSLWLLGGLMLLGGFAVAPTLSAVFERGEAAAPRHRVTEALTVLQTGIAIGLAAGSSVTGVVIDHWGASAAFLCCGGFGLVAWATSLLLPEETYQRRGPGLPAEPEPRLVP
jgi:predicted MFS family arabinose efflux permease